MWGRDIMFETQSHISSSWSEEEGGSGAGEPTEGRDVGTAKGNGWTNHWERRVNMTGTHWKVETEQEGERTQS